MLLVSGKEAWKQILNFQIHKITDKNATICRIEEPFTKDVEEVLISDVYNENEVNNEEGESDTEVNTF